MHFLRERDKAIVSVIPSTTRRKTHEFRGEPYDVYAGGRRANLQARAIRTHFCIYRRIGPNGSLWHTPSSTNYNQMSVSTRSGHQQRVDVIPNRLVSRAFPHNGRDMWYCTSKTSFADSKRKWRWRRERGAYPRDGSKRSGSTSWRTAKSAIAR